jgi:hypothetical protein
MTMSIDAPAIAAADTSAFPTLLRGSPASNFQILERNTQ